MAGFFTGHFFLILSDKEFVATFISGNIHRMSAQTK